MRRGIWLTSASLAVLGVAASWWIGGLRSPGPSIGAIDEASSDDESRFADSSLLRAGPRATPVESRVGRHATSPYAIVVLVLDEKLRPMPGVTVSARLSDRRLDPEDAAAWGDPTAEDRVRASIASIDDPKPGDEAREAEGTSDALGLARVAVPRPGNYEVSALPVTGLVGTSGSANPSRDKPVVNTSIRMIVGSTLLGRVVDDSDKGVVAIVSGQWAKDDFDGWNYVGIPGVASGADGSFTFPAVPDGKGKLVVRIAGRGSFNGFTVTTPSKDRLLVRIPAGGVVHGRVVDSMEQPVPGADVTISTFAVRPTPPATARGGVARGRSGPDGVYRIEGVVAGRVTAVSVAATGFVSLVETPGSARWSGAVLKEGDELTLDLALVRGGSVKGRVIARTANDADVPVIDAEVFLLGPTGAGSGMPVPRVATVDAAGEFAFPGVPLGKFVLFARSPSHYLPKDPNGMPMGLEGPSKLPGGVGMQSMLLVLSREGETLEKTLRMTKGVAVSGVVRGPDGAPVAGAAIRGPQGAFFENAWQYGIQANSPPTLATSGPDGRFTIPGLAPNGECVLSAHKPPFASKWCTPFAVTEGESPPDVVLDVEQGGSISGRVVDADGRAAPGIDVSAWSQQGGANDSVSSGPDGTFLLSGLGPGGQQLGAWSQAFGGVNRMLDPPLKPGETREGVELKLVLEVKTVSKLTGVLVEEDGTPVGERYLSAQGAHNSSAWTQTDADGAFTFRGLSEGKATLTLQTQSGDGNWVSAAIPDATFDVPSSGARVVLPRKEPTTVVVGRVLLPHGALVPLCNVTALAAEAKATATSPAVASFSVSGEVIGGEFRREVPAGRAFELIVTGARDADGKPENVLASTTPVTTPAGPQVIRLLSGRSIRGRVLSADGKGIADATVNGSFGSVTSDEDGSFEILGVEADEVSLTVQPIGSYMTPPQPTIAKAGATDVVIRMDSGLAISGRVVDADGNPVESGNVRATPTVGSRLSLHANLDEGGTFRIEHVPRDAVYDIVIRFWGAAGKLSNHKSWTTSGVRSGTEDLVARVDGGEVIRGVVVDGEGQPVPSAWVNASPASGGGATQSAQSDESGRFAVGGLDPGPYVLRASIWNGQQRTSLPASAETGERGVRIVMPNSVKLTGRILADGDKAGFSILVRLAGPLTVDSWPQVAQGQAAADGSFALDVPMDLFLDVQVSRANDDRFGYLGNVKGGTGDVSIALVEGRSIEGTAEDAVGQAVAGNTWVIAKSPTWYAWAAVDAAGAFRFRGLPAGAYRLRMTPVARPNAKPALLDTVAGSTGVRLRLPE